MAIPEIWSELHHDLILDAQGGIKKVINVDAVISSVINILRTTPGERVMFRSFGCRLSSLLFENIQSVIFDKIADEIRTAITLYDDRVNINKIAFFAYPDRNTVDIKLNFSIQSYDEIFERTVSLTGSNISAV